jgi:hypothetical protein
VADDVVCGADGSKGEDEGPEVWVSWRGTWVPDGYVVRLMRLLEDYHEADICLFIPDYNKTTTLLHPSYLHPQ